jgi:hypothetical protein
MDKFDRDLMSERAEDLDQLFDKAEQGLLHCSIHPDQVVYLDGGCQSCAWAKRRIKEERKARKKRRGA